MSIRGTLAGGFAAVALAAGLAAMPQPASASTDGMPDGSWRQSCERAYVEQGTLHARCRRASGQYVVASAQIGSCQAFGNRDGTLVCESYAGGSGTVAKQWTGSFRDTCRDVSVDKHGKLRARCRKDNGTYKSTNLQASKCPTYRAGNRDGNLFCEADGGYGRNVGQWGGSFSQSCRDVSVDSYGTLTATCQAANGSWRRTSLSSRQCSSHHAGNRDGKLFCETAATGSSSANSWNGSFRNSCRNITIDSHGSLTADCQAANGSWRRSSLAPLRCRSLRAGNQDGTLVCESVDGNSQDVRQWGGSFSQSCRDASVDSNGTLMATCQAANGTWQRTSLAMRQCSSHRAGNRDGHLVCEDGTSQDVRQWGGSFSQSCREVSVDSNGTLTATCQAANGSWRRTSLATRQCSSYRAGNRDGSLVCEDGTSQDVRQWGGSFSQSCRDVSVDSNGTLTATCQTMNGTWNRSSLAANRCGSYQAGNSDGTLVCER